MKKTLATIGVTTALAFTGVGVATMASAQTPDADADSTTTDDSTETNDESRERGDGEGRRGNKRGGCGPSEAVAEALGMEVDELKAELEAGSTLAEVAEANDVDPDELVELMVANATERIEEKVAEGDLTDEEAAEKLANKTERIEDKVFGDDDDDDDEDDADEDDLNSGGFPEDESDEEADA